jgi:hypothetical protein
VAVQTIQDMTKRLSPTFTPHDYRRTVATSLRRNGVDESSATGSWAGGRSDVFQRYYDNVADPELHRGILRLYADDPVFAIGVSASWTSLPLTRTCVDVVRTIAVG